MKKRRSLAARLRAAQDTNTALRRELDSAYGETNFLKGDSSGVVIAANVSLSDKGIGAVKAARLLGAIVTVHPDPSNPDKFQFRAKLR